MLGQVSLGDETKVGSDYSESWRTFSEQGGGKVGRGEFLGDQPCFTS